MDNNLQAVIDGQKNALGNALVHGISETLNKMGEDVNGLDWFSSHAEAYNEIRSQKAA